MLVIADTLDQIRSENDRVIGFWGVPPRDRLIAAATHLGCGLVDLDVDYGAPHTNILPDAYCHIMRNCVDNAMALKPRLAMVIAATGKEKCDAGRYAAWLIGQTLGVAVEVTGNTAPSEPIAPFLCQAYGPLKRRIVRVMRAVVNPLDPSEIQAAKAAICRPTHGFWGTPPHPIDLLDLFPETTHVFGWTRCVAQGCPADLTLETAVPTDLPIVFFSQGFCPKAQLARYLADIHRGMHVDVHDALNAATQAKIEAFIRLSGAEGTK